MSQDCSSCNDRKDGGDVGPKRGPGPVTRRATALGVLSRARRDNPKADDRPGTGRNSDESRSNAQGATLAIARYPSQPQRAGSQPMPRRGHRSGPGPFVQQTHGEDLSTGAKPISPYVTVSVTAPRQADK